jgi:uncharacterized LabA/DUF88 family protein
MTVLARLAGEVFTHQLHQNRTIFMESEHEQFSSSQLEADASNNQGTAHAEPGQNAQPEQEAPAAESAQNEAAPTRHRRRRPTRSARQSRSAAAEPGGEEAGHEAEAETAGQEQPPQMSAEVAAEAPGDLESTAPESEPQPASAEPEMAWGFQHWREQPPTDWNPFLPQTSEPTPFPAPAEPSDMISDQEAATWSSPAPEAALEGNEEVIAAVPAQEAMPEAPAAPVAAEQVGEEAQKSIRATLSGVEVRPPRRYRFDRPAPATREAPPQETAQAAPQAAAQPEPQPAEKPKAAPHAEKKRGAPAAAGKEAAAEAAEDKMLGAVIERELTETPEIEADVVAAEELARATQAALEEEVAEALESLTAPGGPTPSPRSGRRRRRRSGAATSAAPSATPEAAEKAQPPTPPPPQPQPPQPYLPAAQEYQVVNGLQHIGQPQSPFGGPEPSSARGFGPVPRGVAMPAERGVRMPRPERTVETGNVSVNQLAMIFTQAIQQQTDRLLMELRRSQGTPSMTVNFPPMPSNERIGVFVDVANLLYSARNMRIAIDFGRLLDFLRGNRRLVRAHAYCPTSPDPRAEQMFLDAVKGLGYRITTKNYKTFSSGAKKADLDLDLCMDIVRLVDAGAVDCISLVSGDSDFLPLLEYCSDHGVRVEVAAFDEATASILRQSCDLFINLSMVEEIRA